jgi:antitoxin (DNA-binding transcriptional repressor) of toxin-antitoxin stability system
LQKARRGEVIEVTVRGEVVARIVAPEAATDDAARRLLAAMRKMGPLIVRGGGIPVDATVATVGPSRAPSVGAGGIVAVDCPQ